MYIKISSLIKKGLKQPADIPSWIYRHFFTPYYHEAKYEIHQRSNDFEDQTELIHEFISQDEFVLIILDACRFDYFERQYDEYLDGNLACVWSPANRTPVWVPRTWSGTYDLTYVSGSNFVGSRKYEKNRQEYRATDHIENVIEVNTFGWVDDLNCVPPESVANAALDVAASDEPTRMVVHYMQPHKPYIGDNDIDDIEFENFRPANVTDEELKQAYRDNLDLVLLSVQQLISQVDCPVVITSDHGELLGEGGKYLHSPTWDVYNPILRKVPWLRVDEGMIGTEELDADGEYLDNATEDYDIDEQLAHLGYK